METAVSDCAPGPLVWFLRKRLTKVFDYLLSLSVKLANEYFRSMGGSANLS
ncbi:hypothetical protein BaRGS_00000485, partial [Batillaria attramentaria]